MKRYIRIGIIALIIVFVGYLSTTVLKGTTTEQKEENKKEEVKEIYQEIATSTTKAQEDINIIKTYQEKFNNSDIIGELSIENTDLKVPVAQSTDNDYYLNHLLDKSKNSLGSVYLDYRNKTTDRKIIIYGHNSENVYTEFNLLENYLKKSYYESHSKIVFKTESSEYNYQIFSVYIAIDDFQHVNLNYDSTGYANHLNWLKNKSIYNTGVEVSRYDDILILQTCYFDPEGSYLIVAAKKVK